MTQPTADATPDDIGLAHDKHFELFAAKMRDANVPELAIRIFQHYYHQLRDGATGFIASDEAGPITKVPDFEELNQRHTQLGVAALGRAIVLKLNGGLGTSMGMTGPKALLPVKEGLSFLDIIIRQVLYLRQTTHSRVPLVLMNSFNTREESMTALQGYPDFTQDIPIDFLQHKKPKIWQETLEPAVWPADPDKEWCPPGHGDIYVSLMTSGMLQHMLDAGYEYLFVSNSDNLGATLDLGILGYIVERGIPFLMEVANRTQADKKGGHLGARPDGQLLLRELSQCPPDELALFQDIDRYRYFNTNNLWIHLPTLQKIMQEHDDLLYLPLIRNEKTVDPTDLDSPRVYQLETAMGSAIALFPGAEALRVPRSRFIPVKRNNDLLLLWSDVYELRPDYSLRLAPARQTQPPRRPPLVSLDDRYYLMIDDMLKRFPYGAPSLLQCTHLRVEGDVYFGKEIVLEGDVDIANESHEPFTIADGTRLLGQQRHTIRS
jgi:UTP--glucose-1-phosphate uridylyltransferase